MPDINSGEQGGVQLEASWLAVLEPEFQQPYMQSLKAFLRAEKDAGKVYYNYGVGSFPSTEGPGISSFYKNEQGAFLPFLLATPFLFILGASLAYFVVIHVPSRDRKSSANKSSCGKFSEPL